jgi:hypothetical protein
MVRFSAKFFERRVAFFAILFPVLLLSLCRPDASRASQPAHDPQKPLSVEEKRWGIKILSLRPTSAGYMLDLRFQVLDPEKASHVLSRKAKAFVLDEDSGKTLPVPVTKSGPLRQTTRKPETGRHYFSLFSNPGGLVKEGSKVTVIIGDFRAEHVVVQSSGEGPVKKSKPQLKDLNESKKQEWEGVQKVLRHEHNVCVEHCGNDEGCLERCEKAFETRKDRELQRLMHES